RVVHVGGAEGGLVAPLTPGTRSLKLRSWALFGVGLGVLGTDAVFRWARGAQGSAQFLTARRCPQPVVQLAQVMGLRVLAHGLAAPVAPLALPETPLGLGGLPPPQRPRPPPFQIHEADQTHLRPGFHLGERAEAITP